MRGSRTGLGYPALLAVVSLVILFGGCGDDSPSRPLDPCATPTFEPAPGVYDRPVTITMLSETPGATIRYTTDGSEPDEESQVYSHPFAISTTLTLRAGAWKEGFSPSEIATGGYTIRCVIDLTAPLGGEVLPSGSTFTISWTSTVCTGPVRIELLLNDAVCDTIASGATDSGSFDWIVQGCHGVEGAYRIRVTDIPSGAADQSDNSFAISTHCRITVIDPSGGEIWQAGNPHTIRWTTAGVCGSLFRVDLLVDGVPCLALAEAAVGDSLVWEAEQCNGLNGGYRIRVSDPQSEASGSSATSFSISPPPPPACSILVITPAGGEEWLEGTGYEIRWVSFDCSDLVRIDLLREGLPCSTLAASTEDDGTFIWFAARCDGAESGYRVKVSDLRTSASGSSAGDFSIPAAPCSLDLTSPDGGEIWMQGTTHPISWNSSACGDSVRLELLAGGAPCLVIAGSTPNDGSFSWSVEGCVSQSGYSVRVLDLDSGAGDASAGPFTIPLPPCDLELVSPNGGESWQEGTDHEITWNAAYCVTDVRIELLRQGLPCETLAEHAPNTGRFPGNPVRCGTDETGYAIRIIDLSGDDSDVSDATFSIPAPPPCRPQVTSPAAGERWLEGTSHEILWEPSTCDASVRIELLRTGVFCLTISNATENTGSFPWTARQCATTEDGYKVRVTGIESGEAGESEQTFSISPECELAVTYPAGGEALAEESSSQIQWTRWGSCGGTVRIELLRNDSVCATIAAEAPNTGVADWNPTLCDEEEEGYRIRITDTATGSAGSSPDPFRIVKCGLQVISPNGGESWTEATAREILWSPSSCGETVDIELLRNGVPCGTVAFSTTNNGSLSWTVRGCGDEEVGYTIRITDTRTGRSDESDAPFTIPIRRLTILSPAGGENYAVGSEQTITWTSSNCEGNVQIVLICGEGEYYELVESTENDGSFTWTSWLPCDAACGYRIYLTTGGVSCDAVSESFCICPPCELAVTSPNGGETWLKNTPHDILWNSTDCADSVKIELLRTGELCKVIANSTPDDGGFSWTADNCGPPGEYSIRITGPCGAFDTSDATFSIPECVLSLNSPNGGEHWAPGSQQTITWNSSNCGDAVRISLMENGGLCQTIAQSTSNTGSFPWTVQICGAVGCGYKVRITDLETNKIEESAAAFCICPPCVPAVTSPNGGESWEEGTVQEIRWDPVPGCDAEVKIELVRSGSVCQAIVPSTPNDGSFAWTTQRCQGQTDGYTVRVTGVSCLQSDESDLPFEITPPPCRIAVALPNGGESWTVGASHEIVWNPTGECGELVALDLLREGSVCLPIAASTPNDGSYAWVAERCGTSETGYSIRVTEPASGATDASDQVFSLPVCQIAVTAPAGGETWQEGTGHGLAWTSSHCTGTVRIELLRNGLPCATISAGTPDDGSFDWTAANCGALETGYEVRVVDITTGSSGTSGGFSIPEPPCAVTIAAPNGGERWIEGVPRDIAWNSASCGTSVKIDLLRMGTVCRTIADSTANDGVHAWTAQRCGADTAGYSIRITDRMSGAYDASDGTFTVPCPSCPVAITSPNGGEIWQEGTPRTISWSPPGCDTAVKIELLLNDAVCRTLDAGAPDNGSFTWTPERCGAASTGYRIRITGVTCGRKDRSDGTFSITLVPDLLYFPSGLELCAGQQGVVIPVYGRNSQALKGYGISLCFDPAVFECVDIVKEGTRGEGGSEFVKLCEPGCARAGLVYSAACPPQIGAGEGILLKVIVNVKPGAAAGATPLDLTNVGPGYNTMTLCNGASLDPVLWDGTVQICPAARSTSGSQGEK